VVTISKEIKHDVKFRFEAEARMSHSRDQGQELEAEFLASRSVWARSFNITDYKDSAIQQSNLSSDLPEKT